MVYAPSLGTQMRSWILQGVLRCSLQAAALVLSLAVSTSCPVPQICPCQQGHISVARAARSAGDRDSSSTSGRAARQGLIQMVLQEGAPCPAACAADEELKGILCAEAVSD